MAEVLTAAAAAGVVLTMKGLYDLAKDIYDGRKAVREDFKECRDRLSKRVKTVTATLRSYQEFEDKNNMSFHTHEAVFIAMETVKKSLERINAFLGKLEEKGAVKKFMKKGDYENDFQRLIDDIEYAAGALTNAVQPLMLQQGVPNNESGSMPKDDYNQGRPDNRGGAPPRGPAPSAPQGLEAYQNEQFKGMMRDMEPVTKTLMKAICDDTRISTDMIEEFFIAAGVSREEIKQAKERYQSIGQDFRIALYAVAIEQFYQKQVERRDLSDDGAPLYELMCKYVNDPDKKKEVAAIEEHFNSTA